MYKDFMEWQNARYPYDFLTCGRCLSMHVSLGTPCSDPTHAALRKEAGNLKLRKLRDELKTATPARAMKIRNIFVRLREKYAAMFQQAQP